MHYCVVGRRFKGLGDVFKYYHCQNLEKVPSGCVVELDFPSGQENFNSHLSNGLEPRQVVCQAN